MSINDNSNQINEDPLQYAFGIISSTFETQCESLNKRINFLEELLVQKDQAIAQLQGRNEMLERENDNLRRELYSKEQMSRKINLSPQPQLVCSESNLGDVINDTIINLDNCLNQIIPTKKAYLNLAPLKEKDFIYVGKEENKEEEKDDNQKNKGSNFFKECKKNLQPKDYASLITIVKMANMYKITKNETYSKIETLLKDKYPNELREFQQLFFIQKN